MQMIPAFAPFACFARFSFICVYPCSSVASQWEYARMRFREMWAGVIVVLALAVAVDASEEAEALASLRRTLNEWVDADGVPRGAGEQETSLLTNVAAQAREWARRVDDPAMELAARQLEVRAQDALLRHAHAHGSATAVSFRLIQLKAAVASLETIDHPEAPRVADYWRLLVELIESARNPDDLQETQTRLLNRLRAPETAEPSEREPASDEKADRMATARFWALLRLCDQLGWSETLYAHLRDEAQRVSLTAADRARPTWRQYQAMCARLGERVALHVRTDEGEWSLSEGRFAVIALHAGEAPAGWAQPLTRAHEAGLDVLEVVADEAASSGAWPRVTGVEQVRAVLAALDVVTLPRVVVVDARGRYALSGVTGAAIERAVELAAAHAALRRCGARARRNRSRRPRNRASHEPAKNRAQTSASA